MAEWMTFTESDGTQWRSCRHCNRTVPASSDAGCECERQESQAQGEER